MKCKFEVIFFTLIIILQSFGNQVNYRFNSSNSNKKASQITSQKQNLTVNFFNFDKCEEKAEQTDNEDVDKDFENITQIYRISLANSFFPKLVSFFNKKETAPFSSSSTLFSLYHNFRL